MKKLILPAMMAFAFVASTNTGRGRRVDPNLQPVPERAVIAPIL